VALSKTRTLWADQTMVRPVASPKALAQETAADAAGLGQSMRREIEAPAVPVPAGPPSEIRATQRYRNGLEMSTLRANHYRCGESHPPIGLIHSSINTKSDSEERSASESEPIGPDINCCSTFVNLRNTTYPQQNYYIKL